MKAHRFRWMLVALALIAGAAAAAPKEVLLTREVQDLYRVGSGTFYIKTSGCSEQVFGDRVELQLNISSTGGMLHFRNGRLCAVQKFLRETDGSSLPTSGAF